MKFKVNKNGKDVIEFLKNIENEFDIEKSKIANLRFVLEELLTNSIKHAAHNLKPVEISIVLNDNNIAIEYHDHSELFNIHEHFNNKSDFDINLDEMQEGGLGIFLVFNLIKDYEFFYDNNQLKNIMKFNL